MEYYLSEDATRCIIKQPFGFACYKGKVSNGKFTGDHVFIVQDFENAVLFLEGKTPHKKVIIYDKNIPSRSDNRDKR